MLRKFQIIVNNGSNRAVSSFVEFVAPFSGQIVQIDIWAKNQAFGENQIFNFAINGSSQFSGAARPKVSGSNTHEQKTGLSFAVVFGDYLKFDLESVAGAGLFAPAVFQVVFEDNQPVTAYELAVDGGFVGDETAWLASLQGADGSPGTDGDDGADGVGIPAGGTTGQVLAKASGADFDTEFIDAEGGGGSLPAWLAEHPDNPPVSPSAYDDEFPGTSLDSGKWTAYNSPGAVSVGGGYLSVTDTVSDAEVKSVLQDISALSGVGVFRAKLNFGCLYNGQSSAGIILRHTTSGQAVCFFLNQNSTPSLFAAYIGNNGALSSSGYSNKSIGAIPEHIYLELTLNYPYLLLKYSLDGVNFLTFQANEDVNAVRGTIGSFSYIGAFVWNFGSTGMKTNIDWIRKI